MYTVIDTLRTVPASPSLSHSSHLLSGTGCGPWEVMSDLKLASHGFEAASSTLPTIGLSTSHEHVFLHHTGHPFQGAEPRPPDAA